MNKNTVQDNFVFQTKNMSEIYFSNAKPMLILLLHKYLILDQTLDKCTEDLSST